MERSCLVIDGGGFRRLVEMGDSYRKPSAASSRREDPFASVEKPMAGRLFRNCSPTSLAVRAKLRENLATPFARDGLRQLSSSRRVAGANVVLARGHRLPRADLGILDR